MTATHGFSSGLLGLRTRSALSGGRRIGLLGMVGSLGGGLPWIRRRGLDSRAWLSRSCDLELLLAAVALENSRSRGSARIIGLGGAGLDWGCGASQVWVKSSRKLYDWSGSPDVNKSLRGDIPQQDWPTVTRPAFSTTPATASVSCPAANIYNCYCYNFRTPTTQRRRVLSMLAKN